MSSRSMPRAVAVLVVILVLVAPAAAQLDWRQASIGRSAQSAVMDPIRNRLVVWADGIPVLGVPGRVMEWDGRYFTHPPAVQAPALYGKVAWDPAQGRVLLLSVQNVAPGGTQTWSWDGQIWTRQFPVRNPPPLDVGELATDFVRRRVVLHAGWGGVPVQTWEWDGSDWQQSSPATMPPPRAEFAMAWNRSRGRVTLHGGTNGSPLGDTWEWDGWTWLLRASNGPARRAPGLATAPDGNLVLFGGVPNNLGPASSETWVWDGSSWAQRFPAHSPGPAVYPIMALDAVRGATLMRSTVEIDTGTLWEWDGQDWLKRSDGFPVQDQVQALAADPDRGRVVGFGWHHSTPLTWEWDGSTWRRFAVAGPAYRQGTALAFSGNGEVLLFGGEDPRAGIVYGDAWLWNGAQWTQLSPGIAPSARREPAMTYDEARAEVVLFGGRPAGSSPVDETWTWNGAAWAQRSPATVPPGRAQHAMAYDRARGVVVMFGGTAGSDTWEWDGVDWRLVATTGGPPPLTQPMLTSAPDGRGVVLYGGSGNGGNNQILWRWDGTAWTQLPFASWRPRCNCYGAFDPVHGHVVMLGDSDVWLLEAPGAAEVTPFGAGCAGSAGRATLAVGLAWPFGGNAVDLKVEGLVAGTFAAILLGTDDQRAGALPLPADLGRFGMPACWMYTSSDAYVGLIAGGGTATLGVPVPTDPSLVGVMWFAQAAAFDAAANALGVVTTNALRLRIGR